MGSIHPQVVKAMEEIGIELTGKSPSLLTREATERADVVVTMGCGDECPVIPGKRYLDWDLPDPKDAGIETVRRIRDQIEELVNGLLTELDSPSRQ